MRITALVTIALIAACTSTGPSGPTGRLSVSVAALELSGVTDADYRVTVTNGEDGAGDVVWSRTLGSASHGDAAGSLSYVGTCDAGTGTNTVELTLLALRDADGTIDPATWMNPTPIRREAACVANGDVAVQFDLTIARQAKQGFFDVAVQFDDIFCSAKLDCCAPSVGTSCAGDGSDDIDLLFDADGDRARTMVLAFACTAGTETGVDTELVLEPLTLDCDVNSGAGAFAADVAIDPVTTAPGNQCVAAADALSGCAAIGEVGDADADDYLFQVAVFSGDEPLPSGGASANKVYWNVALGVLPGISACTLRTRGTAYDAAAPDGPPDGQLYPFVTWDVDLGSCGAEQLSFDTPGAPVTVTSDVFELLNGPCSNGSGGDCNVPGATLIPSSAFVDPAPPEGWTQCAGFVNTDGDDVTDRFLDGCLETTRLRIRIWDPDGELEEDIEQVGTNYFTDWPDWGYLNGTPTYHVRHYWPAATFFTTTDGKGACNPPYAAADGVTFGAGQIGATVIAGFNDDASEYGRCTTPLPNRTIALYR